MDSWSPIFLNQDQSHVWASFWDIVGDAPIICMDVIHLPHKSMINIMGSQGHSKEHIGHIAPSHHLSTLLAPTLSLQLYLNVVHRR